MMKARSHCTTCTMARTMASKTGFGSVGDLAMILRISAVAAWRACASFSSRFRVAAPPRLTLAGFASLALTLAELLRARFGAPLDAGLRRGSPFLLGVLLREPPLRGSRAMAAPLGREQCNGSSGE